LRALSALDLKDETRGKEGTMDMRLIEGAVVYITKDNDE